MASITTSTVQSDFFSIWISADVDPTDVFTLPFFVSRRPFFTADAFSERTKQGARG